MIVCLGTTPAVQRVMVLSKIQLGLPNRTAVEHYCASGKSINAAKVIHALGAPVRAITIAGGDTGRFFREDLQRLRMGCDIVETERPTRICTTAIAGGHATEFVEESSPIHPPELLELWKIFEATMKLARLLILSGSLAPGVPDVFYATCAAVARRYSIPVIIDARGEPLRLALEHKPFVAKPNRMELSQTVGMPVDTDAELRAAIRRLISAGPSWAIITSGSGGVVVSDGEQFFRIHPPEVNVISAIGSGDAFAGGLATALYRGESLPDAARLAVACGASNAANLLPGQITPDEVDRYQRQIALEPK